jgi:hypothetical protein
MRKSHNFADGLGSVAVAPVALTQPITKLRRAPMGLGEEPNRTKEVTGFTKLDGEMKFAPRCEERLMRRNPELCVFPLVREWNRLKSRGDNGIVEELRHCSSVREAKRPEYQTRSSECR